MGSSQHNAGWRLEGIQVLICVCMGSNNACANRLMSSESCHHGHFREYFTKARCLCRAQLVSRSRGTPQASWDELEDGSCGGESASKDGDEDWAHLISTPEPGCVLLANPMLFGSSQTYFEQAVILVIEHSDQGSMGIILNKPSELRLKQMEDVVLDSQFRVFAKNKVYLGGDVDADGLYLLHEHRVPGAAQVLHRFPVFRASYCAMALCMSRHHF